MKNLLTDLLTNLPTKKGFNILNPKTLISLVPEAGLEPAQACTRGILSPLRLPIPPLRHTVYFSFPRAVLASSFP